MLPDLLYFSSKHPRRSEDPSDIPGITRDDLAAWYIEEHAEELESQEEALETADLIRRIISRLVTKACRHEAMLRM